MRVGNDHTQDFTPVASVPGRAEDVRDRMNDMKVAPARAELASKRQPPR